LKEYLISDDELEMTLSKSGMELKKNQKEAPKFIIKQLNSFIIYRLKHQKKVDLV
jgi:hypothetical protein